MGREDTVDIDGVRYKPASVVSRELGVSRQTLWRWRSGRRIPAGYRYRNGQTYFTLAECQAIYEYANRMEPAEPRDGRQPGLFDSSPEDDEET